MNTLKFIITAGVALFAQLGFAQQNTVTDTHYKLVWQDTFDGGRLDEINNWTVVVNGKGGGNRELQYYRRENVTVGNEPISGENCLIITARKEKFKGKKATSGRLTTQHKVAFKYGKIEARIKLPKTANGLWPAFWMLGNDFSISGWPKCGEIDIIEMGNVNGIKTSTQDRYFNGACHWGESFNNGAYPNYGKSTTNPTGLQDDFHLYTLIWDENAVKMYLDYDKYPENAPYFEMPIYGQNVAGSPARYFHKPYYILFNLAVGGNFPQIRHVNDVTALSSGDAKMYVDFVKVFQKGQINEEFVVKSVK